MRVLSLTLMLIAVSSGVVRAAPDAYSVNSDSPDQQTADSLYRIDLATGKTTYIGRVRPTSQVGSDIEGLAFDRKGTLFGADDADETLLSISTGTGLGSPVNGTPFNLQLPRNLYDYGLTFTCDDRLLMVSDQTQTLYQVNTGTGAASVIGEVGGLGAPITGIAAYGETIVGLGQGVNVDDNGNATILAPNLYRIDADNGTASLIGALGPEAANYPDAGLAFDAEGKLWAVTDRTNSGNGSFPSQILQISPETGSARLIAEVGPDSDAGAIGFESLAIAPPSGCEANPPPPGGTNIPRFGVLPAIAVPVDHPLALILMALLILFTAWQVRSRF